MVKLASRTKLASPMLRVVVAHGLVRADWEHKLRRIRRLDSSAVQHIGGMVVLAGHAILAPTGAEKVSAVLDRNIERHGRVSVPRLLAGCLLDSTPPTMRDATERQATTEEPRQRQEMPPRIPATALQDPPIGRVKPDPKYRSFHPRASISKLETCLLCRHSDPSQFVLR
jgi:hypothetical protein